MAKRKPIKPVQAWGYVCNGELAKEVTWNEDYARRTAINESIPGAKWVVVRVEIRPLPEKKRKVKRGKAK